MALYTIRSGATQHPEDSVAQFLTDHVLSSGVKDMGTTNHFKVTEKGAGANMSVDVAIGRAIVINSSSNAYPIRNTAAANVLVASNSSGNPRIDTIVLYIDLAVSPNTTASDVAKLVRVQGTPAGSPVAPTDGDIETAIGVSNPYLRLADVAVANGAVSITNANITEKRVKYKIRRSHRRKSVTCAATTNLDFYEYDILEVALDRSPTLAFLGLGVDDMVMVTLVNDTGARTVTWPANIRWFGGTPVLSTTAGHADSFIILCKTAGASPTYDGWAAGFDGV